MPLSPSSVENAMKVIDGGADSENIPAEVKIVTRENAPELIENG